MCSPRTAPTHSRSWPRASCRQRARRSTTRQGFLRIRQESATKVAERRSARNSGWCGPRQQAGGAPTSKKVSVSISPDRSVQRRCEIYRGYFPMTEVAVPASALRNHLVSKWVRKRGGRSRRVFGSGSGGGDRGRHQSATADHPCARIAGRGDPRGRRAQSRLHGGEFPGGNRAVGIGSRRPNTRCHSPHGQLERSRSHRGPGSAGWSAHLALR